MLCDDQTYPGKLFYLDIVFSATAGQTVNRPGATTFQTGSDANSEHWFTSFLQPLPYLVTL